jgi:Fur family ferric uptake transcriptional regulator
MAKAANEEMIRTAENVFREYLRDRGLKYTRERQAMLRAVMLCDKHFEAEELLLMMRQADVRVGKATIYRTLPLLVNCGIVKQVQFSNKRVHYEHTYGQDPHDHMVCRRCGRIIEFDASDVTRLRTILAARHEFHALSHRLQIIGLCNQCVRACPIGTRPILMPSRRDGKPAAGARRKRKR